MNYIVSKFTKDFISQSGECFLYNSRSNSLLKVSKAIHELINKVISGEVDLIKSLPNDVFDYLRKHKILVADSEDHEYILNLELNHNLRMFDRERMILVIAPTTSCNFECDYCFEENKQNKFMQDSTITELIDFIKKFELIKTIHLTWYGGEPLLATKIINKILQKFQNELKNITLNYHLLITNGFYLTKDKISFFKDFPLDEIQVTFDGEKERHNLKRYIKGSTDGSYDTIVSNLDWFCSEFEDTRVSVRINIDKNNVHEFVRLRRELLNRWKDKNVSVYPGILRIEDDTKKCMGCEALLHDDIRELFTSLEEVNFFQKL
jgi:Arylsulfatase regulator (Fe-S oxidoreductase)